MRTNSGWLNSIISILCPRYCVICTVKTSNRYSLCSGCKQDLPWLKQCCERCAIPLKNHQIKRCGPCSTQIRSYTQTICPFIYTKPIDTWVKKLKFNCDFNVGNILAHCLIESIQKENISIEVIVAVPMHRSRWIKRGYNQAQFLGKIVSKALNIPLDDTLVKRKRQNHTQVGLKKIKRIQNIKNNFKFSTCKYKTVAIIDDVVTTSATVHEIAKGLIKNGAKNIIILCASRSTLMNN